MKPQWDQKYTTIAVYTAIVLIFGVLCVFFFLNFEEIGDAISTFFHICSPLIYGAFIAYILNPLMKLYEEKVFRADKKAPAFPEQSVERFRSHSPYSLSSFALPCSSG